MEQVSGFPKNLAFNLRKLQGSIIKQKIVVSSDKSTYTPNDRVIFNLPIGRMIDTRSVVATAKCKAGTGCHFSRGGLNSLIENLQITANSKVLQSTQSYNYIWNCLADVSGYFSADQIPKRIYEIPDPSMIGDNLTGANKSDITLNTTKVSGQEELYLCVSNWLGVFSGSSPTINTNDWGLIQVIITLAPNTACWVGAGAAGTAVAIADYSISEFNLSMDTITFTNSLYNDLVRSALENNGLNISYNDYIIATGNSYAKTSASPFVAQFSTNSLDACIATFRHKDYNTASCLLLGDATYSKTQASIVGATKSYSAVLADPIANEGNHGGFNNSVYFQRCGGAIESTTWYVNSQPFTYASTPISIFNNTLQALDYANCDIGSSGLHPGVLNTGFYNKNYFVDILSLENISGDNNNWVSGLGGNGGVITIQHTPKFSASSLETDVIPVIIAKVSKVLNIKIGRNLDLME